MGILVKGIGMLTVRVMAETASYALFL